MNGLHDPVWREQLQKFEPLSVFTIGRYICKLMVLDDQHAMLSYPYRIFVFEDSEIPIAAFNYEVSGGIGAFYGVTMQYQRMNFGPAPEALTVAQFYDWTLQTFPSVFKEAAHDEIEVLRQHVPTYDGQSLKKPQYQTQLFINEEAVENIPTYTLVAEDLVVLNSVRLFAHRIESNGSDLYFYHNDLTEPIAYFMLGESYVSITIEETPRGKYYDITAQFLKDRAQ